MFNPAYGVRRHILQGLTALLVVQVVLIVLAAGWAPAARAQGVELVSLQTSRAEGAVTLDFAARVTLPKSVEDALRRGVPLYFVAEAQLFRSRWYWRDERVARLSRSWRLAFQPLTGIWRVSLGGLSQSFGSLTEAMSVVSRSGGWKLVDLAQVDGDKGFYLEFSYRLDTSQLPGPMQFGLGGQGDWTLGIERTIKVEP